MGLSLSTLSKRLGSLFSNVQDARILLVGLDNAGKTTLLYKFKIGETITTIPTIGFNTEEFQYKNVKFSMWDVGGQERCYSEILQPAGLVHHTRKTLLDSRALLIRLKTTTGGLHRRYGFS